MALARSLSNYWLSALFLAGLFYSCIGQATAAPEVAQQSLVRDAPIGRERLLMQYCTACHNDKAKVAGFSVQPLRDTDLKAGKNTAIWEKILRRLSLGEMPPKGMKRPPRPEIEDFTAWLEVGLDSYAELHPNAGRASLRRMNRAEYANAVRDLLNYNVDVAEQLPVDDSGYGFDNIADVLTISPTLLDRFVAVAGKVSRAATGLSSSEPFTTQYSLRKDINVEYHGLPSFNERATDDLPLDSRGGGSFSYYAPFDATYVVQIVLNSNTEMDNEILPENTYEIRLPLKAGLRSIGASFEKKLALDETTQKIYSSLVITGIGGTVMPNGPPEPVKVNFQVDGVRVGTLSVPSYRAGEGFFQKNFLRDILQINVKGPYNIVGPGNTPSRSKIFICRPSSSLSDTACARKILTSLATQAYRRPVTDADIAPLTKVYAAGKRAGTFEQGIELGIEAILVSPNFLFVKEKVPAGLVGSVKKIGDLELATLLSFFLWSSIPDQQLISIAKSGQLRKPEIMKQQIIRMLADSRSDALTQNFAGQWLYLRNLDFQRPSIESYPQFDERLRKAMLTETQMFVTSIIRENRSVLDFIDGNYTFLNQRLAEHYGIPGVYGTAFRKVVLPPSSNRGGLLGQASILTVTSYNNRTSVVRRGKWILDNILAAPPPPPPPDIPALNNEKNGKTMTVRQQMELHRSNAVCASCHTKMDPLGFSLENYDAIGAWRNTDVGQVVDASAVLPDGTKFNGPKGLQDVLKSRKNQFVEAYIERLMTYALGRGLEPQDMPTVRAVRRLAAARGFQSTAIIEGIVASVPFQTRTVAEPLKRSAAR